MDRFQDDRYYLPSDPELRLLGSADALAQQRKRGKGPPYVRLGRRVLYRGCDLNGYLDANLVTPKPNSRGRPASVDRNEFGAQTEAQVSAGA